MNNPAKEFVNKTIKHARFVEIMESIERTHAMSGIVGTGMILFGPPGVGKSTALLHYEKQYKKQIENLETPELTKLPIIKVSVPAKPTIKGLLEKLLEAADHPIKNGTSSKLESRLSAVIRNQQVEMIILDEFQHMLREQAQTSTRNVLNFIKVLMDEHKLAVVMCGIPSAVNAFSQYEELYQRFCFEQVLLRPFSMCSEAEMSYFKSYMVTVDRILCDLNVQAVSLSSEDMMKRMMLATEGKARYINRLVVKALMNSTDPNSLMLVDFISACGQSPLSPKLEHFNPFAAKLPQVEKRLGQLA